MRLRLPLLLCVVAALSAVALTAAPPVTFTDVTTAAGIRFTHTSGAFGKKYLPETLGSGVVVLDADGDGWQDLLFINSTGWPGRGGPKSTPALYRNTHDGTFVDVTRGSGLDVELFQSQSAQLAESQSGGVGEFQDRGIAKGAWITGCGRFEEGGNFRVA